MKPQQIELAVYVVGIALLGLAYFWVVHAIHAPLFLVGGLGYIVALRVLGEHLAKRFAGSVASGDSDV